MYYRVYDGYDYLFTGYNTTSLTELKEALLSLIEPETDEDLFEVYKGMDLGTICDIREWEIEESETPFEAHDFAE